MKISPVKFEGDRYKMKGAPWQLKVNPVNLGKILRTN